MGTNRVHDIDKHIPERLSMAGGADIRQVRCNPSRNSRFSRNVEAWSMMMHYLMWAIISISCVLGGALFRGQQVMIMEEARTSGKIEALVALPFKQLAEIRTHDI